MWQVDQIMCMVLLVLCSIIDIRKRQLPLVILEVGGGAAVVAQLLYGKDYFLFIGGIMIGLFFCAISKVTGEGLGYGDSLLILVLGMFLGLWEIIYLLVLSFLLAAGFAIVYMIMNRYRKRLAFPFVPFLMLGYMGVLCL